VAESFERIHRSILVNMGVLPLQFEGGANAVSLGITGSELFEIHGVAHGLKPMGHVTIRATGGKGIEFKALVRIDTPEELIAFRAGSDRDRDRLQYRPPLLSGPQPRRSCADRALRVGRRLPRRVDGAARGAGRLDARAARSAVRGARLRGYRTGTGAGLRTAR